MRKYLLLTCLLSQQLCFSQFNKKQDSILLSISHATNDSDKIVRLASLADLYYTYRLDKKADSIVTVQLQLAESNRSKDLVVSVFFGNSTQNIKDNSSKERFDFIEQLMQKAIDYAKSAGNEQWMTMAHAKLSELYRTRGQMQNALDQANASLASATSADTDSLKIAALIELGEVYKAKKDLVLAYKTFNNAYDLAWNIKNKRLQAEVFQCIAELYKSLGDKETAVEYLFKSIDLFKSQKDFEGLVRDYILMIKWFDNYDYFNKIYFLADSLNNDRFRLQAESLEFASKIMKNIPEALHYLEIHPELKQSFINRDPKYLSWIIGEIYLYGGKADIALSYLNQAEPFLEKEYDLNITKALYDELGYAYNKTGKKEEAINYYKKALDLSQQTNDPGGVVTYSESLSKLYKEQSQFEQALFYYDKANTYEDSLQKFSNDKDLAVLEISREKKIRDKELADEQTKKERRRNLQYWGISILLVVIFCSMIIFGMFPVSKYSIKILSYFAFICLFEFIILLIESFLHHITQGEPLKIWGIKIFIIALLVPLQHFLEHSLTRFLMGRKLIEARKKLSVKKMWSNMKKKASSPEAINDDDTAIL
jgi:tetratricopeptide (TPR) repeat protein